MLEEIGKKIHDSAAKFQMAKKAVDEITEKADAVEKEFNEKRDALKATVVELVQLAIDQGILVSEDFKWK